MWYISKENSQDLGFAIGCLFSQSITLDEFKEWLYIVIKDNDIENIPSYIFDLLEFNQGLFHISNVIGFVPNDKLSKSEQNALTGIAVMRNVKVYDSPISKNKALLLLDKNPHILERFKTFFPFIVI